MNILRSFIDIIYPPRCCLCRKFLNSNSAHSDHFCNDCLNDFPKIEPPLCTICGISFVSQVEEDHLCERCIRKRPFYDSLRAPYVYEHGIMDAIHQLKYTGKSHLANSLGLLLTSFAGKWLGNTKGMLIVPVPLHPKRLRERGFNQSLLLAKVMNPLLETELDFLSLRRVLYTKAQTGLKFKEREKNVRRAFELDGKPDIKGKSIILVDDVATTGNTMNECARVLKKAGCKKIYCLAVARTASY